MRRKKIQLASPLTQSQLGPSASETHRRVVVGISEPTPTPLEFASWHPVITECSVTTSTVSSKNIGTDSLRQRNHPLTLSFSSSFQMSSQRVHYEHMSSPYAPLRKQKRDFPGGAVVKNPPANAGALVQEDPTCCRATKPVHHNY